MLRSYLRAAREALEDLGPEGGSLPEQVLRDVREQAALGLTADAGAGAGRFHSSGNAARRASRWSSLNSGLAE